MFLKKSNSAKFLLLMRYNLKSLLRIELNNEKEKILFLFLLFISPFLTSKYCFTQSLPTKSFKKLDTMRMDIRFGRSVFIESEDQFGNKKYQFNGKWIDKYTYDSLQEKSKQYDIGKCLPCYLMEYNNDVLVYEGVRYMDCVFGRVIDYLSNGRINYIGHFKDFPYFDSIKSIRNYCAIKHGEWIYFNEREDTAYKELWEDGVFLFQKPEQDIAEIWRVDFMLDDSLLRRESYININDFKKIKVQPQFKNKSRKKLNLFCTIETSVIVKQTIKAKAYYNDLAIVSLENMIKAGGYLATDEIQVSINLYNNQEFVSSLSLKLKSL